MKKIGSTLLVMALMLAMVGSSQVASAQNSEPPTMHPAAIAPPPPREGVVSGVISHVVQVTIGEDGTRIGEGERGYVEEITSRLVGAGELAESVTWAQRSSLQYNDHGDWEEVQGASDNWTDSTVYMLRVLGELYRNGDRQWNNTVTSYNTSYVSSGYSPWGVGYNAFWQSRGTHSMKVTSSSSTETGNTEVSRQF